MTRNYIVIDSKFKKLIEEFTRINRIAYHHIFLICNPFLSRAPRGSDIFDNYIIKRERPVKCTSIPGKLLRYYVHSLYLFLLYILGALLTGLIYPAREDCKNIDNKILIENYLLLRNISLLQKYDEKHFPGLLELLEKRKQPYILIPKLYGYEKLRDFFRSLKVLKHARVNALLEFHVLNAVDYLRLLGFILTYPFKTIRFALGLGDDFYESRLIRQGLLASLDKPAFYAFARYLFGLRLGSLEHTPAKCISWYENQNIDKAFIKGLRSGGSNVRIYGCQLFVWSPSLFSFHVDSADIAAGLAPDKVLVSGEIYLRPSEFVPFHTGPCFRYGALFSMDRNSSHRSHTLVLLSYFENECREVIDMLKNKIFADEILYFRFHPSTDPERLRGLLPPGHRIASGDLYAWLKTAKIVIGTQTGSLIEAACLGVPVIHINMQTGITLNPFPEYGKGLIWDSANSVDEIFVLLNRLTVLARNDPERLDKMARDYLRLFFTAPTEEATVEAFELSGLQDQNVVVR